jgi:hypothetical protein
VADERGDEAAAARARTTAAAAATTSTSTESESESGSKPAAAAPAGTRGAHVPHSHCAIRRAARQQAAAQVKQAQHFVGVACDATYTQAKSQGREEEAGR